MHHNHSWRPQTYMGLYDKYLYMVVQSTETGRANFGPVFMYVG